MFQMLQRTIVFVNYIGIFIILWLLTQIFQKCLYYKVKIKTTAIAIIMNSTNSSIKIVLYFLLGFFFIISFYSSFSKGLQAMAVFLWSKDPRQI
jgi:hypothetical protein